MAKYVKELVLNKPDDFVQFIMEDYLRKNSFIMADWKGEPAYRTGDAMMEGYKYLRWYYGNGVFHLEAWMKGTFGGEWNLNGFVGCLTERVLSSCLPLCSSRFRCTRGQCRGIRAECRDNRGCRMLFLYIRWIIPVRRRWGWYLEY